MTQQRFFLPSESFTAGRVVFPAQLQPQLSRVLRLQPGDEVDVLDGSGSAFRVRLERGADGWQGTILSTWIVDTEPRVSVSLYFGLTQREKLEWILQKGTEIGVSAFHPFISRRTLARQVDDGDKRLPRWGAILREAAEQSGRGRVPAIFSPAALKEAAVDAPAAHDLSLVAWEDEAVLSLRASLMGKHLSSLALFCGPEGGFEPAEIDLLRASGIRSISLGRRVLRMETAAILAPALALYELGCLNPSE